MPARAKGGKRQARQQHDADYARELVLKEDGEEYGLVLKELGNRMLRCYCLGDSKTRRCHIPKKIRERIKVGDVILVVLREFATADDEADIFHKYQKEEVKRLQEFKHIPADLDAIMESESAKIGVNYKAEIAKIEQEYEDENVKKGGDDEIDDL